MEDEAIRNVVRETIEEFVRKEQTKSEPAHRAELLEERKRREALERRVNELIAENQRSRQAAEEAERSSAIRSELQRLGVTKVELAFRAVKDSVARAEDGRLIARTEEGQLGLREYLTSFVAENPELLPARIAGGSGGTGSQRPPAVSSEADIDRIRPGMNAEEAEKIRQEILRVAAQARKGQ